MQYDNWVMQQKVEKYEQTGTPKKFKTFGWEHPIKRKNIINLDTRNTSAVMGLSLANKFTVSELQVGVFLPDCSVLSSHVFGTCK